MQLKLMSTKIWLAIEAIDFRCSIDGLCNMIKSKFAMDAKEGTYIFYSRDRKKLKLLTWHRNGFVLLYKRLEQGRFQFRQPKDGLIALDEKQLSWLLAGLDWDSMSGWPELEFDDYF
jgi:transposase